MVNAAVFVLDVWLVGADCVSSGEGVNESMEQRGMCGALWGSRTSRQGPYIAEAWEWCTMGRGHILTWGGGAVLFDRSMTTTATCGIGNCVLLPSEGEKVNPAVDENVSTLKNTNGLSKHCQVKALLRSESFFWEANCHLSGPDLQQDEKLIAHAKWKTFRQVVPGTLRISSKSSRWTTFWTLCSGSVSGGLGAA